MNTTTTSSEVSGFRGFVWTCAMAATAAAAIAFTLARRSGLPLFAILAGTAGWLLAIVAAHALPLWRWRVRGALSTLLALPAIGLPIWLRFRRGSGFLGATDATLQLAAVWCAVAAFGFYFLGTLARQLQRESPSSALLSAVTPQLRLLACAHALVIAALLGRLYAQWNLFSSGTMLLSFIGAAIAIETVLHGLLELYKPARLRSSATLLGRSVLLSSVFGDSAQFRSLLAAFEKNFGVKLADAWLLRLLRETSAPMALVGAVGLWASTAVTRVPVDSHGVLAYQGRFADTALQPGLHFHAPWPWGRVEIVATETIQEIALGFERDLAGPVLWAEKHFDGEQNLLVGQGEELLTINVPVHFRIRDAVAYARRTGDARAALESLGYRELLTLTATHTAFGLMTTDREEVAAKLRAALQAASDRLGLGLDIVFVGLKDIHPPVPVAPAYQDVVSAEEEQVALVDQARAYAAHTLASAQTAATALRLNADAQSANRKARAAGESSRFLAPLAAYREQPDVYRTRLRLDTLDATLGELRSLILVPGQSQHRRAYFLGGELPAGSAAGR